MSVDLYDLNYIPVHHHNKTFRMVIVLVIIQISYIVLDLVEAQTEQRGYGIAAGIMMSIFGLFIIVVSGIMYRRIKQITRDLFLEGLEGCIYLSLGVAITVVRNNKRKKTNSSRLHVER